MSDEVKFFDYNLKGEGPNGVGFNIKRSTDGRSDNFVGVRTGIYGDVSLIKAEKRVSEDLTVGFKGPSAGASLGFRVGNQTNASAIVEPSLVNFEGKYGPVVGSVGLNATTGVKVNEEGFKVGLFGFGLTCGVGGKFSVDTPFGSAGVATATHTNTHQQEDLLTN